MPGFFIMRSVAVLFTLFIITIIILADTDHMPRLIHAVYDYPYGDKLGHFILFGLLNFFVTLACIRPLTDRPPKQVALWIGLSLALLVGLEEFSQKFFATRTFDLLDLAASYLGLIVGGFAALKQGTLRASQNL